MRRILNSIGMLLISVAIAFALPSAAIGQALTINGQRLVPLHSTKKEVEKVGVRVRGGALDERYATDDGFLDVRYAEEPCIWHGWNVPAGTVLRIRLHPKKRTMWKDLEPTVGKDLVKTVDHTIRSSYTDRVSGAQYVVLPDGELEVINYRPAADTASLRCSGFPPYDAAAENYSPLEAFEIEDPRRWDVGLVGYLLLQVRDKENSEGTIFVYEKRGQPNAHRNMRKQIEDYAYSVLHVPKSRLVVRYGGIRDQVEVEAFVLPTTYPPPMARPKYPTK